MSSKMMYLYFLCNNEVKVLDFVVELKDSYNYKFYYCNKLDIQLLETDFDCLKKTWKYFKSTSKKMDQAISGVCMFSLKQNQEQAFLNKYLDMQRMNIKMIQKTAKTKIDKIKALMLEVQNKNERN